jgi:competence protein ComEC
LSPEWTEYQLIINGSPRFTRSGAVFPAGLVLSEQVPSLKTRLQVYGEIPRLAPGDIIRVRGRVRPVKGYRNFESRDTIKQLERDGIERLIQVDDASSIQIIKNDAIFSGICSIDHWRYDIRQWLINESTRPGLFAGLAIGDRSLISQETRDSFHQAGLAHLLAISGQHLGLIALLLTIIFRVAFSALAFVSVRVPHQKIAWIFSLAGTFFYVALAGYPLSAQRAFIILTVFVMTHCLDRMQNIFHGLSLAALIIVIADPASLFTLSFQLSFLAVLSIGLFLKGQRQKKRARWLSLVQISCVVTLFTAPLLAYSFSSIPLIGVATNLFAIPFLGFVILPTIALTLAGYFFVPSAAEALMPFTDLLLSLFFNFAKIISEMNFIWSISISKSALVSCYIVMGLYFFLRMPLFKKILITGIGALILFIPPYIYGHFFSGKQLHLTMFDVGQGDALLLEFPNKKNYLIDGGGFYIPRDKRRYTVSNVGQSVLLPLLRKKGLSSIDAIVLSHPHPDHYEGLLPIIDNYSIGKFYYNGNYFPDSSYRDLLNGLKENNVEMIIADRSLGSLQEGDVQIRWLNPPKEETNFNENSLVMRIDYGETCLLLTGDIEKKAEQKLVRDHLTSCDVLKVPHHGSRTSSTRPFLEKLKPRYALISAGRHNPFNHPHANVLKAYDDLGISVWRTDLNGAIRVTSDGEKIWINSVL